MKVAYFQCFSGISGDMTLGALIDAGVDWREFQSGLAGLSLDGYELTSETVTKKGIRATRVRVRTEEKQPHRHFADIQKIINASTLPALVKEKSIQVFLRLAEAEARIHHTTLEKIHFHEVGAQDAIVDIVGAALGLWLLGVEEVYASPVNTGEGLVECAHGSLPVPAPATLELLRGAPIYSSGIEKELTTPTGAAILTTLCRRFGPLPAMKVIAVGYGAGGMDLAVPNVLRLIIGEQDGPGEGMFTTAAEEGIRQEEALVMEANIDDMNPEFYDHLIDTFLTAGAMDVFLKPIQMKKNRPATTLSVLLHPEQLSFFYRKIFDETTSLGVRVYPVTKYMASFEIVSFHGSLGTARIKIARQSGRICNIAPEYEDCRKMALEKKIPLKQVYDTIKGEYLREIQQCPVSF
ncbi:MAG: nickel pincer cofactor biosynthesis protein LarC [Desulfuromonadales bacterium]|nr:nickel pincer cofactor biosynthesis protein LarC [Desulfuromonadales bacterium]